MIQIPIANRGAFPPEVLELLQAFHRAGFFDEAMLVGSWVMPLYWQAFGIPYEDLGDVVSEMDICPMIG